MSITPPGTSLEGSALRPLSALLGEPLDISYFLSLAIGLSSSLMEIHDEDQIHRGLTPNSILINSENGTITLSDSTHSSQPTYKHGVAPHGDLLNEMFAYMSPEQTGRMNRIVDHRSDLYSLGVILYEMITGSVPFQADDTLSWVHCHIARPPLRPDNLTPNLPLPITEIILKLLAKTPEDRYQSATGLIHDLKLCLSRWHDNGVTGITVDIDNFLLGEKDIFPRMLIPQKLYGREKDIDTLLGLFEQVVTLGSTELVMISGYSGVGKTSLVRELYQPIVGANGLFISGKFDQYKSNIPYATFGEAFGTLIRQILTESEERIAFWREKLMKALGLHGQLIVEIIPLLELIIGPQASIPELPQSQAANRFTTVFRRFIAVFPSADHPLVLFLDDLQWADAASLKLLNSIVTDGEIKHLMLIGAYRNNEVTPSHPLILMLDILSRGQAPLHTITLSPLAFSDLVQLMDDTFHPHEIGMESLSKLIYEKTAGNPFFVSQFLLALQEEQLVTFDKVKSFWRWDSNRINAMGYTDNVVDLMLWKLRKLSMETQQMMQLAACIGNSFNLATLLSINDVPEEAVRVAIDEALRERLMLQITGDSFSFLHDRVQQAAYSLIPEEERVALHLRIGRLMLKATPTDLLDERIFDIVSQFNRGIDLITAPDERCRIAKLNLTAGEKAKASTAYVSSLTFLSLGAQLLGNDFWQNEYQLCFEISRELAEVEYLNSHYDRSRELIEQLVLRAESDLERAQLYNILIVQHTLLANYADAIATGREALRLLQVIVPETDLEEALSAQLQRYAELLGARTIPSLADEPECVDPEKVVCLELLSNMVVPARYTDSTLFGLVSVFNVNVSLQYGPTPKSTVGYSAYGMVLNANMGNYQDAYAFGLVALKLSERFQVLTQKCQASFMLGHYLNHWVGHLKLADSTLNEGIQAGLASGEMQWTGYTMAYKPFQPYYRGEQLELIRNELPSLLFFTRKTQNRWATDTLVGLEMALNQLVEEDCSAIQKAETVFLEECRELRSFGAMGRYAVLKARIHYLYGRIEDALNAVIQAQELGSFFSSSISVVELNFIHSLILAAGHLNAGSDAKASLLDEIRTNQQQMLIWANNCEENFQHQYLLVEAELANLEGRDLEAMRLYDRGIASARENGFIHNEALGNELASRFYRQREFKTNSLAYLSQARACYCRWGADQKVRSLDDQFPALQLKEHTSTPELETQIGHLDALTVIKASQAISGEIVLSNLLEMLMQILLENAGAQKVCLLLWQGDQPSLAAHARVENAEIKMMDDPPGEIGTVLPLSMVNYVKHTLERIILDDAAGNELFATDPYIVQERPLSILCLPLLRQGTLIGLLYLENSLVRGSFTADRIAVLELLAAQAAISLESAVLYQERSRAENALKNSERRLADLIDFLPDATFAIDLNGVITLWNRTAEEFTGAKAKDMIGKGNQEYSLPLYGERRPALIDLVLKPSAEIEKLYPQITIEGDVVSGESFILNPKKGNSYVLAIATPLYDSEGKIVGAIESVRDISERKKSEEDLKKAKESAEAANATKSLFLANMSHELRTPMSSILGMLELTLNEELPAEPRDYLETSLNSAHSLLRILDDILDITRIEAGKIALVETPFSLTECVNTAIKFIAPEARRKGLDFFLSASTELPETLTGDQVRLRQVLINIIGNAVKFTKIGRIEVRVSASGTISAGMREFTFSVTDTGIGIPEAKQGLLFRTFSQVDPSHTRSFGGTGLGLAISKELVELMGGTITFESEPGKGSTFSFTVPLAVGGEEATETDDTVSEVASLPPDSQQPGSQPKTALRVLIVEDDPSLRRVTGLMLKRLDVNLDFAEDGLMAIEIWERGGIDLILMDIQMPRLNGIEATLAIREKEQELGGHTPRTPIIAMTAHAFKEDELRCLASGMDDYIAKPIQSKRFMEVIDKFVKPK